MVWLKSLVIILGLLIFCCLFFLGYGFYKKTSNPEWQLIEPEKTNSSVKNRTISSHLAPQIPFGKLELDLPKHCSIIDVQTSENYLIVRSGKSNDCSKIIIFTLNDFTLLGTISLKP